MPDVSMNFFNLEPPGAAGSNYTDLATDINGVPLGRASAVADLSKYFGYSDKDSVGSSLDEVLELAMQLNIALATPLAFEEAMQNYLNTINPTLPNLPPIQAFLLIAEQSLQQGKIGGFQLSLVSDREIDQKNAEYFQDDKDFDEDKSTTKKEEGSKTSDSKDEIESLITGVDNVGYGFGAPNDNSQNNYNTQTAISNENIKAIEAGRTNTLSMDTETKSVSLGNVSGGNSWLAGNVYVLFLMEFMELQRILMKNKAVQGKVELASMNMIVELAKSTAEAIMETAKINQMIHIVTAVMAAVAIAMSIGGIAYGAIGTAKGSVYALDRGTMIGQMGPSFEKFATSITQAATDIAIAELEGLKEMLQAYRQIAQKQMDKAGESFRASEEQITQAIQALDKIRDGLQQAIANALHK